MSVIKYIILAFISLVLITFCVVNRSPLPLDLFPFPYILEIPVFVFALSLLACGIIIGTITVYGKIIRLSCRIKELRSRILELENENKIMRYEQQTNLPAVSNP